VYVVFFSLLKEKTNIYIYLDLLTEHFFLLFILFENSKKETKQNKRV